MTSVRPSLSVRILRMVVRLCAMGTAAPLSAARVSSVDVAGPGLPPLLRPARLPRADAPVAAAPVQTHLGKVYGSLVLAVLASVVGSRYALTYAFNQTLATFLTVGALVAFLITPHQRAQAPALLGPPRVPRIAYNTCLGESPAPVPLRCLCLLSGPRGGTLLVGHLATQGR